jgi:hypothetical protein
MRFVELRRERSYLGNAEDFCENFRQLRRVLCNLWKYYTSTFSCGPRLGRSSCSALSDCLLQETDLGFPPVAVARSGNALWPVGRYLRFSLYGVTVRTIRPNQRKTSSAYGFGTIRSATEGRK